MQDGELWFNEMQALSTQTIVKLVHDLRDSKAWRNGYIPFARDLDDNYLVCDTTAEDAVHEYDASDGLGTKLASSFSNYLEDYRDALLSNRYEFVEELGVVERTGK